MYSNSRLAIYFTHGSIQMSILLSQFVLPSPSPHVHMFLCLHLNSCPAKRFISTIFLDFIYIYIFINILYLFFSDLLHSVWQTLKKRSPSSVYLNGIETMINLIAKSTSSMYLPWFLNAIFYQKGPDQSRTTEVMRSKELGS